MRQYQTFIFDRYRYDPDRQALELTYGLDDEVCFREVVSLPGAPAPRLSPDDPALDRALFTLFLIGGISYYKTCCPREILIRPRELTAEQAVFWNRVWENGLGEFFYRNDIDFRSLICFPASRAGVPSQHPTPGTLWVAQNPTPSSFLLPMGGGKDSIVTMELLKGEGHSPTLFRMGRHPLIGEVARIAGLPLLSVERSLSPELFRLNAEGALNGHVPITAYLSALTVVLALLYGFDAVLMSNERSASEGNTRYLGMEINHQWSKGLEFERLFQAYLRRYVTDRVEYASVLRPMSELNITRLFVRHPEYFPCATSCNANWRILAKNGGPADGQPPWCGRCPKCAFCFAMMAAFLPRETVVGMFGRSLYGDASLLPLYRQLTGVEGFKPFECVGTREETYAAFLLAHRRQEWADEPAMRMFTREILPCLKDPDEFIRAALTVSREHAIPRGLLNTVSFPIPGPEFQAS